MLDQELELSEAFPTLGMKDHSHLPPPGADVVKVHTLTSRSQSRRRERELTDFSAKTSLPG